MQEIPEKCRSCGESQDWKYQFNVFSTLSHRSSLLISDILNSSCSLNIHHDDFLPKNICGKCFGFINVFYVFREQCQKADFHFRNNIDPLQNKSKEEYLIDEPIMTIENNNSATQSERIFYSNLVRDDLDEATKIKRETLIEEEKPDSEHCKEEYLNLVSLEISEADEFNTSEIKLNSKISTVTKIDNQLRTYTDDTDQLTDDESLFMPEPKKLRGDFLVIIQRNEQRFKEANIGIGLGFRCTLCRRTFKNSSEFMEHLEAHPINEQRKVRKGFCSLNYERLNKALKAKTNANDDTNENQIDHSDNELNSKNREEEIIQNIEDSQSLDIEASKRKRTSSKKDYGVCDICGNSYSRLSVHRLTHFNYKPYECDICGKRTIQLSTLRQHMMVHSGKARYKCDICSKPCYTPASLRIHQQFHTNDYPFECQFCDRKFRRRRPLMLHENKVHLGLRYQCKICSLVVKDPDVLRQHIYVHDGLPFMCSLCPKRCKNRKVLQRHLKIEHDMHAELDIIQKNIPVKIESMTPIY